MFSMKSRPLLLMVLFLVIGPPRPGWDAIRIYQTAAEKLEELEQMAKSREAINRAVEDDPDNVCNFVGDAELAARYVREIDPGQTVEHLMDPRWIGVVCGEGDD